MTSVYNGAGFGHPWGGGNRAGRINEDYRLPEGPHQGTQRGHPSLEVQTRTTLIDPMLQALGWDVSDPSLVTIEPKTDDGWADYALLDDRGKTVIFVEAKRLADKNVHIKQTVKYAVAENYPKKNEVKVNYCALTNGDLWELYDLKAQETVLETSIVSDETAKCALQLLGLWRRSMADADRVHSKAVQPVVSIEPTPDPVPPTRPPASTAPPAPVPPGWTALNGNFEPKGSPAPRSMRLPDGSEAITKSWQGVIIQTSVWLHRTGRLTSENGQLLSWESAHAKANRYILSRDGKHPDSTEFRQRYIVGDKVIVALGLSAQEVIRRSIRLLKYCGQDPSRVLLQLG